MSDDVHHLTLGLVLRFEQAGHNLYWTITDTAGVYIGTGFFVREGDAWRASTAEVKPPWRNRGLYRCVLVRLARRFGFVMSGEKPSAAAAAAWRRTGAHHDGQRWLLVHGA